MSRPGVRVSSPALTQALSAPQRMNFVRRVLAGPDGRRYGPVGVGVGVHSMRPGTGHEMRRNGRGRGFGVLRTTLVVTVLVSSFVVAAVSGSDAAVPAGFSDTVVVSGLNTPTAVRFAA